MAGHQCRMSSSRQEPSVLSTGPEKGVTRSWLSWAYQYFREPATGDMKLNALAKVLSAANLLYEHDVKFLRDSDALQAERLRLGQELNSSATLGFQERTRYVRGLAPAGSTSQTHRLEPDLGEQEVDRQPGCGVEYEAGELVAQWTWPPPDVFADDVGRAVDGIYKFML